MSAATCPYCGAKLNLGLKFCVVCGRHVTADNLGRVGGGLRGGFRPADITRRLDEMITVARFRRSRRSHHLERGTRFVFINTLYLFVATGLFYAALQFSLEMVFPGKYKQTRIPFEKIQQFVQEKASGLKIPEVKQIPNSDKVVIVNPPSDAETKKKADAAKAAAKPNKSKKKSKKKNTAKPKE